MGYRIEYGISGRTVIYDIEKDRRQKWPSKVLCILLISGALIHGFVNKWIWDVLFPGYNEGTIVAADHMIEQIKEGESIGDAVSAFCKEIIVDGQ